MGICMWVEDKIIKTAGKKIIIKLNTSCQFNLKMKTYQKNRLFRKEKENLKRVLKRLQGHFKSLFN